MQYHRNQVRPEAKLWIFDDDQSSLINLGSGTFRIRIGHRGQPALMEKTTGITGAAGSGTEASNGTPNLVIAWASGDLDIEPGEYEMQIEWNIGTDTPRYWFRDIEITDIIQAPA